MERLGTAGYPTPRAGNADQPPHRETTVTAPVLDSTLIEALIGNRAVRRCCPDRMPARGHMANLAGVVQLLKKEQDRLTKELHGISAALAAFGKSYGKQTGTRGTLSAAARARIGAAQRARWAKMRASKNPSGSGAVAPKRTISAVARKKMAAAQKARWAKVRAGKKAA